MEGLVYKIEGLVGRIMGLVVSVEEYENGHCRIKYLEERMVHKLNL